MGSKVTVQKKVSDGSKSYYSEKDVRDLVVSASSDSKDEITFVITGRYPSLNFLIAKTSWAQSMNIHDNIIAKAREAMITAGIASKDGSRVDISLDKYETIIQYNSRMDVDNTILVCKYFTDAIRKEVYRTKDNRKFLNNGEEILKFKGVIVEDNKNYFRRLTIEPNEDLPHNTYIIKFVRVSQT